MSTNPLQQTIEALAKEKGIANGQMVKVKSNRGEIKAVAVVTRRIKALDVIDAFTSSTRPPWSATTAMMSSAALPNVALRKPPMAGPDRRASSSVPRPMIPASGTSEIAARTNTQTDSGAIRSTTQEAGAATMSRFRRLAVSDETTERTRSA